MWREVASAFHLWGILSHSRVNMLGRSVSVDACVQSPHAQKDKGMEDSQHRRHVQEKQPTCRYAAHPLEQVLEHRQLQQYVGDSSPHRPRETCKARTIR